MLRYHFSLASKQVLLSIALIVCTLIPLGIFIYEESVENIQQAYIESIEGGLYNVENRIIQNWREQNILRALHISKIKKVLRSMSTFTSNHIEYILQSGQPLENVYRKDEFFLTKNMHFYIFDKNGVLFLENKPENAQTLTSLNHIFAIGMEELNSRLTYADNSLFYVLPQNLSQNSVLAHVHKIPLMGYYLVTIYFLVDYDLEIVHSPEFLYEVLEDSFDYDELLEGGFFLAYDTSHKRILTQSKTDLTLPDDIIQKAIHTQNPQAYSTAQFSLNGEEYFCYLNYLKKESILLAAVFNKTQIAKSTNESMYSLLYLIMLILLIGSFFAFYFGKTLMRPLASLRNMAEKIPYLDFNTKPETIEDLPLTRRDEIGDLARTFSQIQNLLYKNVANLVEVQAKNERINAELNAAREMQMGLLPINFPKFSYINPYNLNAVCIPAREVGGDLYDFFMIDDEHLCFYIGDVSGKGMSAAFFMSIASTLIQLNMKEHKNVQKVTEILNNQLCHRNPENLFLTLFLALYNINTGELKYSSAGHLPALILDTNSSQYIRVETPNFILGLMPDMQYQEHSLKIEHNQLLYIYTDGITEALDEKKEDSEKFYGEARLEEALNRLCVNLFQQENQSLKNENLEQQRTQNEQTVEHTSSDLLKNAINQQLEELYTFCSGTQQADDITCLALYRP